MNTPIISNDIPIFWFDIPSGWISTLGHAYRKKLFSLKSVVFIPNYSVQSLDFIHRNKNTTHS